MKVTRNPIKTTIGFEQGLVYVLSEVLIPEAPESSNWLKLRDVLDPGLTLKAQPGQPLSWEGQAEHLGLVTQQIIDRQAETIINTWDFIEEHGFAAYHTEMAEQQA